jgi:hypothetical protein
VRRTIAADADEVVERERACAHARHYRGQPLGGGLNQLGHLRVRVKIMGLIIRRTG